MAPSKSNRKFRARIMLPSELLLFGILTLMAISGGVSRGVLWQVIAREADNVAWLVVVGTVGAIGLAVSAWEWFCGKHWDCDRLMRVAAVRMWASIFALAVWAYVLHVLFTSPGGTSIFLVVSSGPIAIVFHLWSIFTLKRLYVILHPGFATSRLEARLEHGQNGGG